MMAEQRKALNAALNELFRKRKTIIPKGKHAQGFSYATEAEIIDAVEEAMTEVGLSAPIPFNEEVTQTEFSTSRMGNKRVHTLLRTNFILCHEDGADLSFVVYSEAIDNEDRGIAKAQTSAYRHILRRISGLKILDPEEVLSLSSPLSPAEIIRKDPKERLGNGQPKAEEKTEKKEEAPKKEEKPKEEPKPIDTKKPETRGLAKSQARTERNTKGKLVIGSIKHTALLGAFKDLEKVLQKILPDPAWENAVYMANDNQISYTMMQAAVCYPDRYSGPEITVNMIRQTIGYIQKEKDNLMKAYDEDPVGFTVPF